MDHFAVLNSFGGTSSDLTGPSDPEQRHPIYCCRDKGKERARNSSEDDFQLPGIKTAESSCSGSSLFVSGNGTSRQRGSRSADHSNPKGKEREQSVESGASSVPIGQHQYDQFDDSVIGSSSAATSRSLRRPQTSSIDQRRQSGRSTPTSSSFNDDASLKRSIRELGSSPANSPHQQTLPLSHRTSSLELEHGAGACRGPSGSISDACLHVANARPATANKKRRSLRREDRQGESSAAVGNPHTASSSSSEVSHMDAVLRTDTHARRASLLVNSSTSDTRPIDSTDFRAVSSESIGNVATRTEQPSSDLSHRRSAFLDSARAQRPTGTMRRRRGFYIRDADSLRNDPAQETTEHLARSNSNTSDSFMSEFSRAVDLRLGARPDSPLGAAFVPSTATAPWGEVEQVFVGAPSERSAPQLPYVRTASPLTVPFTASENDQSSEIPNLGRTLGSLRRRTLLPPSDRSESDQRQHASDMATSTRQSHRHNLEVPPTHSFGDSLRTFRITSHRHPSTQRDRDANPPDARPADAAASHDATQHESLRSWQHRFPYYDHQRLQATNSHETTPDDFGAVHRPFGHQGNRLMRRIIRSRYADGTSEAAPDASGEAERTRIVQSRPDADDSTEQLRSEAPQQRDSVPWRRHFFGLRTPSYHPERNAATARPRFEPFAESRTTEPRQSAGHASSRGSLSAALSRRERTEDESALEYLGRLMNHDSMLDEWMAGDVHGPLLRMAIESEALSSNPYLRQLHYPHPSTSTMFANRGGPHLAFDARNFIADEEWAELNSYEGLMQLSERLGAAEVCVPQSLIDALPTCEYGKWDGGSCRPREATTPELVGKGKEKQKTPAVARDSICPICREDYLDSDVMMSIDRCAHAFHAECIKTWFKTAKTCPLCRADAFDEVCLPKLPFQSSSSATAGGREQSLWSLDFLTASSPAFRPL